MTDNDFNAIPAVESPPNVPGLTPAQPREQRKRRPNKPAPPQRPADRDQPSDTAEKESSGHDNSHRIDYCA